MKLSEIRAILAEIDAAEARFAADSELGITRSETRSQRRRAHIAYDRLDVDNLVRQWLPVIEAAKALEIYSDDFCNLYPTQESLEKLTNLLEGIEE